MRQKKRAVKKERNYSIWFTGITQFGNAVIDGPLSLDVALCDSYE